MSPGSTHSKKSSISNKSVNGKNTNSRQYIHNEILSYNLHNRVGTEFYVPSNLYRFIFDFSTSEYCENIYRQIDDFTNSLSSQTEIMTSIIELIKSNILILLNKIYGLTQNRIDIFTQKINEILQDTIWLEKIRDIYIHCYIQRNIFIKYTINYDQHTKTVKIKPNIDLQDADFTKSSYTYSIQNESFNIGRYKNLEIPEVVISNIIFKMLQNDTHNMDFLQEQHFSNFEEKDIYLFKLKNVFIDTYKTNIVPQPFIIDYRLFNQQIDDFRRLQPRHGRVFFHKFSDSSLRQSQKSRSKYSANRSL
jgi:hypothetical protein